MTVKFDGMLRNPVQLHLFRDQMTHGNLDLFFQNISAHLDQFHPVEQRL